MGLEERFHIEGADGPTFLPSHQFGYLMREYVRGKVTAGEALVAINHMLELNELPSDLTAAEKTDLDALRNSIDGAGSRLNKFARALEIEDVLGLGEQRVPGYATKAELKSKLGF